MIDRLRSYTPADRWVEDRAPRRRSSIRTPHEEHLAQVSSDGPLDIAARCRHSRRKGVTGFARVGLRATRGIFLKGGMAKAIEAPRDELLDLAVANAANNRSDLLKFRRRPRRDFLSALQTYAELGRLLGNF